MLRSSESGFLKLRNLAGWGRICFLKVETIKLLSCLRLGNIEH